MKKLCLLAILFLIAGVFVYSQETLSLDKAILASADRIERELSARKKIALLNFISTSQGLSSYVIDELMDIFTNHKKMEVTERSRMDAILRERNYQTSGEVSDAEIKAIGNQLGADYIITGQLDYTGVAYRFRIYAIDIEKGTRVASTTANINKNDRQLRFYINEDADASGGTGLSFEREKRAFELSIGFGGYAQYLLDKGRARRQQDYYFSYFEDTFVNFGGYVSLSGDFFSYVLLDVSYYIGPSIYFNNSDANLMDSRLDISLLGKFPFQVSQSLYLFPFAGVGYDSKLNIKFGGGLDFDISKHFRFNLKINYDICVFGEPRGYIRDDYEYYNDKGFYAYEEVDEYSSHGPSLLLGFRYVF
jgi:TolB-like protein